MQLNTRVRTPTRAQRVLIVEDNPDGRDTLRMLLQLWGYRVETAADGPGGVAAALAFRPHLALIDIGLPGLDGFQVARRLRAALGSKPLLLAQTAYSDPDQCERGKSAGFDAWLVKPLNPEELSHWLLVGAARAMAADEWR